MSSPVPATMTCIEITEPGGPEVLRPTTRPVPTAGDGEVLIEVHSAGVNRPDVLQREGNYAPPPGTTDIPGLEVSGTIAALGPGISDWALGDQVCGLVAGGGYGAYVTAPQEQLLPVPKGLSLTEAACLPETCMTVWTNVFERAALQPGETLMIHGGTSGIGTTAIQMASLFGAKILATAGSDEKCQACLDLGATQAVNYHDQDFVDIAKEFSNCKGIDVTLDMVGGDYIARNIKAAARDGRIVNIAYLRGSKAAINFMPVMLKRLTLTGSTLRAQSVARKGLIAKAVKDLFWPWIEAGKAKPVMYKTFPLAEAADAHALMETNAHIGKIALQIKD